MNSCLSTYVYSPLSNYGENSNSPVIRPLLVYIEHRGSATVLIKVDIMLFNVCGLIVNI